MRRCIVSLLLLLLVGVTGGCLGRAGMTTDLLTYDNISASAVQVKKAVVTYDTAVQVLDVKRQDAMLKLLERGIAKSLVGQVSPEKAAEIAAGAIKSLKGHLANFRIEEQRRAKLLEITLDNLDYIVLLCEQGKKFAIYRADITAQWKAYLEASAKKYVNPMPQE